MPKSISTLLLCLCSLWATAQEPTSIQGIVSDGQKVLEGVHIVNVSTDKFSVSNHEGDFSISLSVGDTLVLSHISMQDLILFVGEEVFTEKPFRVEMVELNNELDEVLLEQRDYALELGIISERKERLSTYERRLHTAGDFKPIHLLGILGGSLPLDPIINAISGRTKEMKRNVAVEKEMETIFFLKKHYLDYMLETFNTTKDKIEIFLDHLVEQESLAPVMRADNREQMKFYLIEEWYSFQEE